MQQFYFYWDYMLWKWLIKTICSFFINLTIIPLR